MKVSVNPNDLSGRCTDTEGESDDAHSVIKFTVMVNVVSTEIEVCALCRLL